MHDTVGESHRPLAFVLHQEPSRFAERHGEETVSLTVNEAEDEGAVVARLEAGAACATKAAIAARRAPSEILRFEQRHIDTRLGEPKGCGNAGKAAADDRNTGTGDDDVNVSGTDDSVNTNIDTGLGRDDVDITTTGVLSNVDVYGNGMDDTIDLYSTGQGAFVRISGGDGSGVYVADSTEGYSTVAFTNTILVSHTMGINVTAGNTATLEATLWGTGTWANEGDWDGAGTIVTGDESIDEVLVQTDGSQRRHD